MSGPSVVVERAPDGWTHIGGPGMHLLIGLDEDDERTLSASDAADGGDLDDVVEVLTTGGMRKAHHFVGVHWQPRTRIVAFGPVSALVTLADGSEHDVRAPSARVWTDLELPEHPERVVLRVLEESERSLPVPPQHLVAGLPAAPTTDGAPAAAGDPSPAVISAPPAAQVEAPVDAAPPAPVEEPPAGDAQARTPTPTIPTFGAAASADGPVVQSGSASSPWVRSWARRDEAPANATSAPVSTPEHDAVPTRSVSQVPNRNDVQANSDSGSSRDAGSRSADGPPAGETPAPVLRSWGSANPAVPVRTTDPVAPPVAATPPVPVRTHSTATGSDTPAPVNPSAPAELTAARAASGAPAAPTAPAVPVATDLPQAPQRDVDSTWVARPVSGGDVTATQAPRREQRSTPPPPARAVSPLSPVATGGPAGDDDEVGAPSYDYLFGHTTAAEEHRKVLAQLTQPDDDDAHEDDEVLSVPAVADTSDAAVTNAAPAPQVPERPIPSAPQVPEGGLISSVPWATPSSTPAPEPEAEVPSFSGRHTPPAAPSLLPPVNTPPPGARAPEAAPLISTGPPPAAHHQPQPNQPETNQPERWAVPHATPVLRTPPTVPIETPDSRAQKVVGAADASDDDETELTVDRSALLEARNAAQSQTFSGPSVLAVLCSSGHPTPPHSDRCRVCGASIPPQQPFTMPRPPLGVLRLSTGDVVTLDRSVLLGRAPRPGDGLAAHDRPHVVKVPSPERDVSRNHVEVILEGWHVLIRDLGTTNGTTVALPGEAPVRLRANDQQVLEPGSLVSMADEVSFTFEAAL